MINEAFYEIMLRKLRILKKDESCLNILET